MTKFTEEQRIQKTVEVADYIIQNNSSTRKAAEHFGISNATVSDWINYILSKIDNKKYLIVQSILKKNQPKSIEDIEIRKRVLLTAKLIMQNKKALEIANELGVSINVVYEDLQTRLPRISTELYDQVKIELEKHSKDNLILGSSMNVEQQKRDENGKFTK